MIPINISTKLVKERENSKRFGGKKERERTHATTFTGMIVQVTSGE